MLGPSRPRLPCNACHCQAALRYHPLSCKPVTRPSCTACRCAGPQVLVTSPPASNGSPPVCACLNLPRPPQRFCFPCRHGAASPTTRAQPLQLVHAMFCSSWSFPRILPCVAFMLWMPPMCGGTACQHVAQVPRRRQLAACLLAGCADGHSEGGAETVAIVAPVSGQVLFIPSAGELSPRLSPQNCIDCSSHSSPNSGPIDFPIMR